MGRRADRQRPRRPNATGRNDKTSRFTMLPHRVLESAAYGSLDLVERALLQELVMLYNGSNNGSLYLSVRDAADRLGRTDLKAMVRAFSTLRECGLIELAKDSHFAVKAADSSRARCWRIAWHAWPECPNRARRTPCWDFEHYEPPRGKVAKRAERRLRALARFRKDVAAGRLPVVESITTRPQAGQIEG